MNGMWHCVLKLFVFIETSNGNMGMVNGWFGYVWFGLDGTRQHFFSHVVIKPQHFADGLVL